jgi:ATP-dependent DNA helicase DinG
LPDAVLRFRQGFGRLLRTDEDFGAVVVLDPRILPTRPGYGRVFVDSLPGPTVVTGPTERVVDTVLAFIRTKLGGVDSAGADPGHQR